MSNGMPESCDCKHLASAGHIDNHCKFQRALSGLPYCATKHPEARFTYRKISVTVLLANISIEGALFDVDRLPEDMLKIYRGVSFRCGIFRQQLATPPPSLYSLFGYIYNHSLCRPSLHGPRPPAFYCSLLKPLQALSRRLQNLRNVQSAQHTVCFHIFRDLVASSEIDSSSHRDSRHERTSRSIQQLQDHGRCHSCSAHGRRRGWHLSLSCEEASLTSHQYDTVYPAAVDQNSAAGTADVSRISQ